MKRSHNITIARSGVQYYARNELPSLGLSSIPREMQHLRVFGVYRPSYIIEQSAELFKKAPIVVGHQNWLTDASDPSLILGHVGDSVSVKLKNSETLLYSTLQFNDEAYDEKNSELSPGYRARCKWAPGVSPDGVEFQITSGEITEVNHVALVPKARGGEDIKILDGGRQMSRKILSGILHYARRAVMGIVDGEQGDAFKNTIKDILENRMRWTEEEMTEHCATLGALTRDLPDSEEKEKLLRFIADIPLIKEEDDATATKVAEMVITLYEQLDIDANEDVVGELKGDEAMGVFKKDTAEPKVEDALPGVEAAPVPGTEETLIPPKAFTLEDVMGVLNEISASLAKMASAEISASAGEEVPPSPPKEGAPASDEVVTEEPKEEKEEKVEEKIGDALSSYSQSLAATNTANSLDDLFSSMKKKRG